MIELCPVTLADAQFLYEMLASRPENMNISHRKMPNWEEHVAFIKSDPYSAWYCILDMLSKVKIGVIYLTKHDEIGIHIKNGWTGRKIGRECIDILMHVHPRKRYLANINPSNKGSIEFFNKLGFIHIQQTYQFCPPAKMEFIPA